MAFGDLAQALAMLAVVDDRGMVELQRIAADVAAFQAGPPHAAFDSFNDQIALQFSNGADDDHYGPAQWAAGVDVFPERDVLDFQPAQFVQDIEEMLDRPGDPIRGPDQHDVEAAAAGVGHHLIQPRPARLRAADFVHILLHDFKAALGSHLTQVKDLRLGVLVIARNSRVQDGALHLRRPFGFADEYFVT